MAQNDDDRVQFTKIDGKIYACEEHYVDSLHHNIIIVRDIKRKTDLQKCTFGYFNEEKVVLDEHKIYSSLPPLQKNTLCYKGMYIFNVSYLFGQIINFSVSQITGAVETTGMPIIDELLRISGVYSSRKVEVCKIDAKTLTRFTDSIKEAAIYMNAPEMKVKEAILFVRNYMQGKK